MGLRVIRLDSRADIATAVRNGLRGNDKREVKRVSPIKDGAFLLSGGC